MSGRRAQNYRALLPGPKGKGGITMKSTTATLLFLTVLLVVPATSSYSENSRFLTTTIENIGRPYTVIDGICVYQEFPSFSVSGDPLEAAVRGAFKKVEAAGKKFGADALVGFDMDFASRPMKGEEGRVLLCGTLVKFRTPDASP